MIMMDTRRSSLPAMVMVMMMMMAIFLVTNPVVGIISSSSWEEEEMYLDMDMDINNDENENPVVGMSSREELVDVAGYGEEKLSKVTVSGKLACHCHHQQQQQPYPPPVSGASVAVLCGKTWARGTTDEYGDFVLDLPSHLHAIPNLEKVCLLKVLNLPKHSQCHPGFKPKHKAIKLHSIDQAGARSYTTNTIHLTPKPSKTHRNTKRRTNNRKHLHHVY